MNNNKLYYHATSYENSEKIQKSGFKLGKDGMFGGGIYFSENPMSATRKARSDSTDCIIVVNLDVGRLKTEERAHNDWNLKKINKLGYDSVQMTHCRTGIEICVYEPSRVKIHTIVHWDDSNIEFITLKGNHVEDLNFNLFKFAILDKKITFDPPIDIDINLNQGENDEMKRELFQQLFVLEEILGEEEKTVLSIEQSSSNYDKPRLKMFQEYLELQRKLGLDYPESKNEIEQSIQNLLDKLKIEKEKDLERVELCKVAMGDQFDVLPNADLDEMIEQLIRIQENDL